MEAEKLKINEALLSEKDEETEYYIFKIVLIGDGAVGKTTIRKRYLGEHFEPHYVITLGADFSIKETEIGNKKIKWQIWDLAGQPRFDQIRPSYYQGAVGALVVYDITNKTSFENLPHWISEFWSHAQNGKPFPLIIIGNKIDLEYAREVDHAAVNSYVDQLNSSARSQYGFGIKHILTSAKMNKNIDKAFKELAISLISFERTKALLQKNK